MKKSIFILLYFIGLNSLAQTTFTINGNFSDAKEKEIRLLGYVGTKDTLLNQTKTDPLGNFILCYPKKYIGAAVIQVKEKTSLIVLLNRENFSLTWTDFKDFNSVKFINSKENQWFQQAYTINLAAQKKLTGLNYLLPLYKNDITKKEWVKNLEKEIKLEGNRFEDYQRQMSGLLYVKKYLKYRTLLQNIQQENPTKEQENEALNTFLDLDFNSIDLFHSGLSKEFFNEYIKQILKLQNKEIICNKLNAFSEMIKTSTGTNSIILVEYSEYLIKLYEKYGFTEVAEKFALLLLDINKCTIENQRLPLLQQYKKMAIGNVAPNLVFNNNLIHKSLADLKSKYKVVFFGASWCEGCKKEIPDFKKYNETFKTKYDANIIFVSIDTNKEQYNEFIKELPFINSCDFKGWEGSNVKNYCVFATPTIFILDKNNTIVAKTFNAIDTANWFYNNGLNYKLADFIKF